MDWRKCQNIRDFFIFFSLDVLCFVWHGGYSSICWYYVAVVGNGKYAWVEQELNINPAWGNAVMDIDGLF